MARSRDEILREIRAQLESLSPGIDWARSSWPSVMTEMFAHQLAAQQVQIEQLREELELLSVRVYLDGKPSGPEFIVRN